MNVTVPLKNRGEELLRRLKSEKRPSQRFELLLGGPTLKLRSSDVDCIGKVPRRVTVR